MGEERHPVGSFERAITKATPDLGRTMSHPLYCDLRLYLLFPLRNTSVLAVVDTIYDLYHDIRCINFWDFKSSLGILAFITSLVTVRILLPSEVTSESGTSTYKKVHIWLPSPRHHFDWRVWSICNRSSGLLSIISWDQEHTSDP